MKKADRDTDTEDAEPKPKKQKTDRSGGGKGKTSGFLAPCPISEQLSAFLGAEDGMVSRADATKRMWDYIKEHKLQVCTLQSFPRFSFINLFRSTLC